MGFAKLPQVLVELFQVELLQVVEAAELDEHRLELGVVLQIRVLKGSEAIHPSEINEYLVDIGIVNRELLWKMVRAVFRGERVEVLLLAANLYPRDVIDERRVAFLEAFVYVEREDMLGDGVDLEDVRTVEIVEDTALDEDVLEVFVGVELAEEELVDRALLGNVILELIPFREPMLNLFH